LIGGLPLPLPRFYPAKFGNKILLLKDISLTVTFLFEVDSSFEISD
jgi:hypothetical protein